jgi:predicted patatin/cPLA2 family phospholipase
MKKNNKKLLIVSSGGLKGVYSAGVLTKLNQELGPNFFDDILACSAGAYSSTYYLADQTKDMEHIWRNLLDGKKFFGVEKKFRKKQILDLDYLYQLMTSGKLKLNIDKIFKSKTNLKYVLTEYKTGRIVYLKPQKNNILKLITGSAAIFPLYQPVKINSKEYVDGGFGEPTPFDIKFIKKYGKILIIQNSNYRKDTNKRIIASLKMLTFLTPKKIDKIINHYLKNIKDIEKARKHKNVFLLTPSKTIPLKSRFDTNKKRINATFDLGIKDAKKAIEFLKR